MKPVQLNQNNRLLLNKQTIMHLNNASMHTLRAGKQDEPTSIWCWTHLSRLLSCIDCEETQAA